MVYKLNYKDKRNELQRFWITYIEKKDSSVYSDSVVFVLK